MKKTILIITTLSVICGCGKNLDYKDYFSFYNRFSQESFVEDTASHFLYKLQYRPADYMALCDIRAKKERVNSKSLETKRTELTGTGQNFCIRIFSDDGAPVLDKSDIAYYEKILQLTNEFPHSIYGLTTSGDTAYCRFSHFERSYNLQPFVQVLFNLHSNKSTEIATVRFFDGIFNQGTPIEFDVSQYIKNLPKLKI